MAIGEKLVGLCREGRHEKAIDTLYADDIVSIEHAASPLFEQRMTGKNEVRRKNEWWLGSHEIHGATFDGPYGHGDRFIVGIEIDVTPKDGPAAGRRFTMREMALYTVAKGKVVKEEFFQAENHGSHAEVRDERS